uniref:G-protein coupled receptors family 1 profile domain-containing protein n=1 Tax=Parascaris equorum TaxID=6256 RepID=A0A914RWQ0_PAREQ
MSVAFTGVLALPFIVIGLMANAMSVRIFSHRQMRIQPVNWYLMLLAISDSVILIGAFFVLTLPRLGEVLTWWNATALRWAFCVLKCCLSVYWSKF